MAFDHAAFSTLLAHFTGIVAQWIYDGNRASVGLVARRTAARAAVEGAWSKPILDGLEQFSQGYASLGDRAAALLTPLWLAYVNVVVGRKHASLTPLAWRDIDDYMVANSYTVSSRTFTRGSVSAGGGNAGSGTVYRLTTDDRNLAIESSDPGVVEILCTHMVGEPGVNRYRSQFRIRHRAQAQDALEHYSSPLSDEATMTEMFPGAEGGLIKNPSFDEGSAGTLAANPPSWTFETGTATNNALDGTYYMAKDGSTTPLALKLVETFALVQYLKDTLKGVAEGTPLFAALGYNREQYSYEGTLAFDILGKTTTVNLAAQTGWNWLVGAMTSDRWFRQAHEDNPHVKAYGTRTSGTLLVDRFILKPMTRHDGTWYAFLGGPTADDVHTDDVWTFTDSIPSDKWLQRVHHLAFRRHLNHTASGSIGEPTVS